MLQILWRFAAMSEQLMRKPKTQTNKPINTDLFNRATVAQDVISAIIYPITIVIIGIIRMEAPAGTVARATIGVHRQCQSQVHATETTRKIHHIVKRTEHLVNIRSGHFEIQLCLANRNFGASKNRNTFRTHLQIIQVTLGSSYGG